MAVSDLDKMIITMDALNDEIPRNAYIDSIWLVAPSGSSGGLVKLTDVDGDPVCSFPINGADYESVRWINQKIDTLTVSTWTNPGAGAEVYVHLRK